MQDKRLLFCLATSSTCATFVALSAILGACDNTQQLTLGVTASAPEMVCTPSGVTIPLTAAAASGVSVTFAGEPSTIIVNPATALSDDDGLATAYALVPYGTQGVVVASAPGETSSSLAVPKSPNANAAAGVVFTFSAPSITADALDGTNEIGASGQIYHITTTATSAGCSYPVAGLPVSLTVVQASSGSSGGTTVATSASTSSSTSSASGSAATAVAGASGTTVLTDDSGAVAADILVPWGAHALLQISGGGTIQWYPITQDLTNPATITNLCWTQPNVDDDPSLYQLTATVKGNGLAIPATTVAFSVVLPNTGAAFVSPSGLTDSNGNAVAVAALEPTWDAGTPNFVVAASIGSSVMSLSVPTQGGNTTGRCP